MCDDYEALESLAAELYSAWVLSLLSYLNFYRYSLNHFCCLCAGVHPTHLIMVSWFKLNQLCCFELTFFFFLLWVDTFLFFWFVEKIYYDVCGFFVLFYCSFVTFAFLHWMCSHWLHQWNQMFMAFPSIASFFFFIFNNESA